MKQKRNDKCACNSGKKYKKCCFINVIDVDSLDYSFNQESALILETIHTMCKIPKGYQVLNLTNHLTSFTYPKYQLHNYNKKVIMLAERNQTSENVFNTRTSKIDDNIMLMCKGSYLTFNSEYIHQMTSSINLFFDRLR